MIDSRSSSTCYYPNGDESSDGDIPCNGSGDNVPCCPMNWSCQDNGLCYLANEQYLGRYTCTDPDWGDGCPEICTYDNTASGNEAVLECSQNSFCCDTNRPDLTNPSHACCETSNSFFSLDSRMSMLPQGSSQGSSPASTSVIILSFSSTPSSSSSAPTTSPSSQSPILAAPTSVVYASSNTKGQSVSVLTSVISEHSTAVSTIISTASVSAAPVTATSPPPPFPTGSGNKNLGAIIGPAVAVPLALIGIALAVFFCLRRRRRSQTEASSYPSAYGAEPKYEGELSPNSPYSVAHKSELEGSSPNLSSSPATAQTGFSRFDSPKIQSTNLSTAPSSAGMRGSSGLSELSAHDQPQIFEVPAGPV